MRSPFDQSPEFRRLLAGEAISLPRVALEVARDADPGLDVEAYLKRIGQLADRVAERTPAGAGPRAILGQINWVLYVEEAFRGNEAEYRDPSNSYLDRVLDRKLGLPITLAILYAAVAAPLGLRLDGVNLPGHFVLRHDEPGRTLFVDAFHGGQLLDRDGCARLVARVVGGGVVIRDEHLEPVDDTAVVARLLRNLKAVYLQEGDFASALPVVRRLAAVLKSDPDETRDWGLVAYRSGHPGEAVGPLTTYLESRGRTEDVPEITDVLAKARRELAERN